ncbi:hypothetical protein CDAR_424461 [Caerostris darwini]|uniref:Ribosomal protein S14 n=1 Tax=Caerostris darwini TaxID=1538125 RepID=A0AAV4T4K9_9ARAC|nr:hypothetical protein CDAR_424461 [Caerostris darwini]
MESQRFLRLRGKKRKFLQKGRKIPTISTQKSAFVPLTGRPGGKEKNQAADFPTLPPTVSASARRNKRSERGEIVSGEFFSVAGGTDFPPLCQVSGHLSSQDKSLE